MASSARVETNTIELLGVEWCYVAFLLSKIRSSVVIGDLLGAL